MAIDALVKPFLSLPLFRGLKPLQLSEIVRRAERIVYRPGAIIVAEDRVSDAAILIVSGTCIRRTGDSKQTHEELIPEGSMVAELAMLVEMVHAATIVAKDQVRALRLTREKMHEVMKEDPSLATHFSSHILKRLQLLAEDLSVVDSVIVGSTSSAQPALQSVRGPHVAQ